MSNEAQFSIQVKNWIFHKLILSQKSTVYKTDNKKKCAIIHVKDKFYHVLNYPNNYSVVQLALLVKRHEALLETILPIPSNPTYINSFATLQKLVLQATEIIKQYNL